MVLLYWFWEIQDTRETFLNIEDKT